MKLRRWLLIAAYCAVSIVALFALAFTFANTGLGRNLIAAAIEDAASSDDLKVTIEGLDGTLPSWPQVSRIVLADATGPWLVLHNVRATWSPFLLIGGEVVADEVLIERVEWLRRPSTEANGGANSPSIPAILVGRLVANEVVISKEVAGVAAIFAIEGRFDLLNPANSATMILTATEIDGGTARLIAELGFAPAQSVLSVNVDIQDRASGPLAALAGLPPDAPMSIKLVSAGNLDAWRASFQAQGAGELDANGTATIQRNGNWRHLTARIDARLGAVGPHSWRAFTAGTTQVVIDAAQDDLGAIKVDNLRIVSPALKVAGNGLFAPAQRRAEGDVTLEAPDGARLSPLLGTVSRWRNLSAAAHLEGAWPTPVLRMTAQLDDLDLGFARVEHVSLSSRAIPDRRWDAADLSVALTTDTQAKNVTYENAFVQRLNGPEFEFKLQADVAEFKRFSNVTVEMQQDGLKAHFLGNVDPLSANGDLSIEVGSQAQTGAERLSLRAHVTADRATSTWDVRGTAQTENLKTENIAINGLLAGKNALEFSLGADTPDILRISKLKLTGTHLEASAQGKIISDKLHVESRLSVPNLAVIGSEFGGRVEARVKLSGSSDAPLISGVVSLTQGNLWQQNSQRLELKLGDATSTGKSSLKLSGDLAGKTLLANAEVTSNGTAGLQLEGAKISYGTLALAGDLVVDGSGLLGGALALEVGALENIAPLINLDAAGTVIGRLVFSPAGTSQVASISLAFPKLRIDAAQLTNTTISGEGLDLFGRPILNFRVRSNVADFDGIALEGLDATGRSDLTGVDLTATARHGSATVGVRGRVTTDAEPSMIRLNALSISRAGQDIHLDEPVNLTIVDGQLALPRSRFLADGGYLSASGSIGREVNLALDIRRLPLWVADLLGVPVPASGRVTGSLRARGLAQERLTDFDLAVNDLKPKDAHDVARNLTLSVKGTTDRKGLNFQSKLSDPRGTTFRTSGHVPFDETGTLSVETQGSADLALLNSYISAAGDRARGRASVSAKFGGTLAAPRVSGSASINQGFFRSARAGLELRDINAQLTGSEQRIVLTSLTATTPNGGTVSGKGDIRLNREAGFPVDLALSTSNAQLVATDLTTVAAALNVRLSGSMLGSQTIRGAVDISRWDIRVPSKLSRPLTPIAVTHRNAPTHITPRTRLQTSETDNAASAFTLDVNVRAPRRVMVRGQGIDAEFGGNVRVTGTASVPMIKGRFDLRRGTITLLSERVALSRGTVAFSGDAIPVLDIAGALRKNDITATITAKGKATEPVLSLTSTPTLPQGEILARIMFAKGTQQLSPFEAAQLAQAVAKWSGLAAGPDILDRLRQVLGIDALSAATEETGGTSVSAGTYVGSGVFVGVKQGASGGSGATVDIDLADKIKLRGEAVADGTTRVGVAAEWEY